MWELSLHMLCSPTASASRWLIGSNLHCASGLRAIFLSAELGFSRPQASLPKSLWGDLLYSGYRADCSKGKVQRMRPLLQDTADLFPTAESLLPTSFRHPAASSVLTSRIAAHPPPFHSSSTIPTSSAQNPYSLGPHPSIQPHSSPPFAQLPSAPPHTSHLGVAPLHIPPLPILSSCALSTGEEWNLLFRINIPDAFRRPPRRHRPNPAPCHLVFYLPS
jgi:hypothetical protein